MIRLVSSRVSCVLLAMSLRRIGLASNAAVAVVDAGGSCCWSADSTAGVFRVRAPRCVLHGGHPA